MHQLAILSTRWDVFFHSPSDEMRFITVHFFSLLITAPFFLVVLCCIFLGCSLLYFFGPDFTHRYPAYLSILINIVSTFVPSYSIDLSTILTAYLTNLATLLITYLIDLIIILTTYPINLPTLLFKNPIYPTTLLT